ncbi:MAG: DNA (cytosine-5-)-methyltransferase [Metamycoplasmataceae bacterium]
MFKILDLFSGAGGFSLGLDKHKEFNTVLATDFNECALKTIKKNNKKIEVILGDITNNNIKKKIIKKSKELGVNFIIGGPPCQGFSMKGKKGGLDDPRNFLFLEYFNIVESIQPEIFIIENVPSIISSSNGYFISQIKEKFEKIGYKLNYDILNASDFGVPQNRKRAFIIGSKKQKFDLPNIKSKTKKMTVWDAISDLAYLESGDVCHERKYITKIDSEYQKKLRNIKGKLFNHSATSHSKNTLYKLSLIPENGTKLDLPIHLRTNQKFKTTWSRLQWNQLSPTIDTRFDTPSNGKNTHPILNRAITPREAARIQSFPDSYEFIGGKSEICKQIGNAVPPLLAYEIGSSILKQINSIIEYNDINFKIYNGDAYKISGNIENNSIDALITDPPYNISKNNNFSTLDGNRKGIYFGDWDTKFDLYSWIKEYYIKVKDGGTFIIFCSYLFISHISDELIKCGAEIKDLLKWIKLNPMPRNVERRYVSDTEYAIWAVKPNKKWIFNKPKTISYLRSEFKTSIVSGKERTEHPTQKSLKLMKEIIAIHTNKNDLILDPFMGSGTTGVAALLLNRTFIGIEKEQKYFLLSKERLEKKS